MKKIFCKITHFMKKIILCPIFYVETWRATSLSSSSVVFLEILRLFQNLLENLVVDEWRITVFRQ